MKNRTAFCILIAFTVWGHVSTAEPIQTDERNPQDTFFLIPHTHWEGAVFKTRQEYLEIGLPNILRALRILKTCPHYRFVLDQVCYIKPFLERYPQEAAAFRRFLADGRLAAAGGTDVMPDVNIPGGESFVRQVLYGKGYFRQKLGVDITVGWLLDTFGHHAQMPQLLRMAGYKSFWFFRGVPDRNTPSEFLWEGIDGTRIPAFWLPQGYSLAYGSPQTQPEFNAFMKSKFEILTPQVRGKDRVVLAGADVNEPEEHVPPLLERFNDQPDAPFELRFATPIDFESAVAKRPERPVVTGELNPIFQGTYSSRIELKQRTRDLERLLLTSEKLGVILRGLGSPVEEEILWRAWEPMLFNHAHDLMSGVMTDRVYEDTLRGYDFSKRIAEEELEARFRGIASLIDTQGEGTALVVFNPLSWERTDIVRAEVGFSDGGVRDLQLLDPLGQPVPVQIMKSQPNADGRLLQGQIAFVARGVPALGYSVYRVVSLRSSRPSSAGAETPMPDSAMENEYYRLDLDPVGGAITRLMVKRDGWNALNGPGNVVAQEPDHGDIWELYRPLDGFSRIAMKDRQPPPSPDTALLSVASTEPRGKIIHGSVVSEFTVTHAFGEKGRFSTAIRLYADLRRIEIHTRLLNNDQFVRYRVMFPTSISNGESVHEIPFGAIQRPEGIEYPAQNWIDYSDGEKGLALLNRGLPGNNVSSGTMLLSLLRSTRIVAYGFAGGYEPGMSSDSAFELGQELTFDYALVPHTGDWRQGAVYRDGLEFNHPLLARTESAHTGILPNRWGFLEISHPQVVVTALKQGADGSAILRVYEAAGQPAVGVKIILSVHVLDAMEVNLIEDPGLKLEVANDTLLFNLRPFEIKTIRMELQPSDPRK
ncbi:MAG: alpha-mannosidase [bacterium]